MICCTGFSFFGKKSPDDEKIGVVLQNDGRVLMILIHQYLVGKKSLIFIIKVLNISNKYKWEMHEDKIHKIVD